MDDDGDDKDDTKRKSRNLSEKKRRDQFNLLINELSSMVANTNRKMDKSTVLKSTIAFLRNQNEVSLRSRVHEIQEYWKPTFLSNEEFTHIILESVDGFIVVFSLTGHILYTSGSVTSLLGHLPSDIINGPMTMFEFVCEEDHQTLYEVLSRYQSRHSGKENQIEFTVRVRNGSLDPTSEPEYVLVQFVGYFRGEADVTSDNEKTVSSTNLHEADVDSGVVFVGTGHVITPQLISEVTFFCESAKSEFTSRHNLDWKFLALDSRATAIIGYVQLEVVGTSGYDYYHIDDLDKIITCHEALMEKGEGTSCYYRFLTKGQQWVWLQTRYYISYHQWNAKPEFVVCTHRVISYVDVMIQSRKMGPPDCDGSQDDLSDPGPSYRRARAPTTRSRARAAPEPRKKPAPSVTRNVVSPSVKIDESTAGEEGGGSSDWTDPIWSNRGGSSFPFPASASLSPVEQSAAERVQEALKTPPERTSSIASMMGSNSNDSQQPWKTPSHNNSLVPLCPSSSSRIPLTSPYSMESPPPPTLNPTAIGLTDLSCVPEKPEGQLDVFLPKGEMDHNDGPQSLQLMFSDEPPRCRGGDNVPTSCTPLTTDSRRSVGSRRSYQEVGSDSASLSEDSFLSKSTNMSVRSVKSRPASRQRHSARPPPDVVYQAAPSTPTYMELTQVAAAAAPQPQYLAAIPLQPIVPRFAVSPLPSTELMRQQPVVVGPMSEQLKRKQQELNQLRQLMSQKEEELQQFVMAQSRYNFVPSLINVPVVQHPQLLAVVPPGTAVSSSLRDYNLPPVSNEAPQGGVLSDLAETESVHYQFPAQHSGTQILFHSPSSHHHQPPPPPPPPSSSH